MASGASSAVQREAPTLKDKLLTAYPDFALFVGVSLSAGARKRARACLDKDTPYSQTGQIKEFFTVSVS